jgi:acyl carrier protein
MEINDIYNKLSSVLQDVLGREDIEVTPGMTASDVEGWDSLNHIRIVLSVEEAFGVSFSTMEIPELQSVDEFVDLIQTKL